jgi:hypothetical protein
LIMKEIRNYADEKGGKHTEGKARESAEIKK